MKILMVCLGNICRSPLAEGILRHKLTKQNLKVSVDSAGTANYHVGDPPDVRSINSARKYGVDISKLKGRQIIQSDFDEFDKIYVMDQSNYGAVMALARNEKDKEKVALILNCAFPGLNMAVPDPYYGGDAGFENVFQLLDKACDAIISDLEKTSL